MYVQISLTEVRTLSNGTRLARYTFRNQRCASFVPRQGDVLTWLMYSLDLTEELIMNTSENTITAYLDLDRKRGSRPSLMKITGLDPQYANSFLGEDVAPESTHSKHYSFKVEDVEGTYYAHQNRYYVLTSKSSWLQEVDRSEVIGELCPDDLAGEIRALLQNEAQEDMRTVLNRVSVMCTWAKTDNEKMALKLLVQGWERKVIQQKSGLKLPNLTGSEKQTTWAEGIRARYIEQLLALQGAELEEIEEALADGDDVDPNAEDMIATVYGELLERVLEVTDAGSFIDARDMIPADMFSGMHPDFKPRSWGIRAWNIDTRFNQLQKEQDKSK